VDTIEAPGTDAGEVGAEAPAAASVVAEAGEEGNG
jgi:hypothetical protein